jgi:putative ABC transport system permease protein
MPSFVRDASYAFRDFIRRPGIPIVIVLSLGCAMGLSTSMFSFVNTVWLAPWPVHGADELRVVGRRVSVDEWRYLSAQTTSFSGLAAVSDVPAKVYGQTIRLGFVSANYFQVLEAPLLLGAGFPGDHDADTGAWNTALISHRMWQTRFGGAADIVGRVFTLEKLNPRYKGIPITIVGVMGPGFEGTDTTLRTQLWLPLRAMRYFEPYGPAPMRLASQVQVFGRLRAGTFSTRAQTELATLSGRFRSEQRLPVAQILLNGTDRYSRSPLPLQTRLAWQSFIIGIVFVTLIACGNVANLLLARGHARRGEIATRFALGASRGRLVRQLLTETFVLTLVAAWVGVIIALWLPEAVLRAILQNTLSDLAESMRLTFTVDRRVFLWALCLSVIACIAFGLAPALRSTDASVSNLIKEAHGNSRRALKLSLLSYQTIVSVMALAIAGLMLRSAPVEQARRIRNSMAGLTVVRLNVPEGTDATQRQLLFSRVGEQLSAIAGNQSVAGLAGQIQPGISQSLHVTPEYFTVLQIPYVSGRTFVRSDSANGVVIVNAALAHRFWPGQDAVGKLMPVDDERVWDNRLVGREVVGVVADAQTLTPTAYLPAQSGDVQVFLLRASRDRVIRETAAVASQLRSSGTLEVLSGAVWIAPVLGPSFAVAWLTMGFGGMALFLGMIGFFSLLQYAVQQKTREIGIRRALGAEPWHVVRSLIAPAARPLTRGLLFGSGGAAAIGFYMRQVDMPSGVNPIDPLTYAAVAGVLTVAAMAASYGPARHAIAIEPSKALRFE